MGSLLASPDSNIIDILKHVAKSTHETIISYQPNNISDPAAAHQLSYKELLCQAETNADRLRQSSQTREVLKPGSIVIVHFENALDSIIWYWSVLLAEGIPAMSSPGMLSQNSSDRKKHLSHLNTLLNQPLCLTRRSLIEPFLEEGEIDTCAVEDVLTESSIIGKLCGGNNGSRKRKAAIAAAIAIRELEVDDKKRKLLPNGHDEKLYKDAETRMNGPRKQGLVSKTHNHQRSHSKIAAIMLTSGTSGNSKAVTLTHHQILAAFRGKKAVANLSFPDSPFLSWVNMDHVANLVHCHLFAIVSGVSQIQVPAVDILADPIQFLNLLSRHRVSRTFAPNFLFAKLWRQLESGKTSTLDPDLNLEALYLDTGGEANVVEVCVGLQSILSKYGATNDIFNPSFGMTETCAGCIFNSNCPSYDHSKALEFASLGKPMPGVRMRVIRFSLDSEDDRSLVKAQPGERGHLEVTGDVVFKGYFNNPKATAEAFTSDGWFRTGDLAYLDERGNLHLDGRTKEMININGVKYLPYELDAALEQANIAGATPSYFCTFSRRVRDTEAVVVVYLPTFDQADDEARFETQSRISQVVSIHTHSRPLILPLREQDMKKSTLGKLSRAKLKDALESGTFAVQQSLNEAAIKRWRQKTGGEPKTPQEVLILDLIRDQLELGADEEFYVNDSILSMGATSMDLMALMSRINKTMQLSKPIELIDLLNSTTARGIANRIAATSQGKQHYDPIVTLQPHGNKTPLFLVHPGIGEVLVFVNMAHYITDRPIYAFRTKGMTRGESSFENLSEMFQTYYSFIKKRQPRGPYAVAGYSFGGMVAFELTKMLEAGGEEVRYCGVWNLPPHIKLRMRGLVWDECVMHLFYFVELMSKAEVYSHKEVVTAFEKEGKRREAIEYLQPLCDQARWKELSLSIDDYLHWIGVAAHNQSLAVDYEPSGKVKCMDVFVANPLGDIGVKDRQDWIENRLMAWKDFVREGVQFHDVQGAHWNMLNPSFVDVACFADTLRKVLARRGV